MLERRGSHLPPARRHAPLRLLRIHALALKLDHRDAIDHPLRLWDRGARSRSAHLRFFSQKNRKRSNADSVGPSATT
jgi:hypothetical protein